MAKLFDFSAWKNLEQCEKYQIEGFLCPDWWRKLARDQHNSFRQIALENVVKAEGSARSQTNPDLGFPTELDESSGGGQTYSPQLPSPETARCRSLLYGFPFLAIGRRRRSES